MYHAGLGLGGSGRERPVPTAAAGDPRVSACAGSRLVCAYPAQAPPPGGNGGGAAASGSAAGDDLYGAGLGVPAPPGDILHKAYFSRRRKALYMDKTRISGKLGNSAIRLLMVDDRSYTIHYKLLGIGPDEK